MKHLIFIFLIAFGSMLAVCSCDDKNDGLYFMEVTVPTKNVISFDAQNGGKDTIKVINEGSLQICGVEIYDIDKPARDECLCKVTFFDKEKRPAKLGKDGEELGTIEYDKDGNVDKITVAEYEISKVTDKDCNFKNEYAVSVSPSAAARKYRLIVSVYCTRPDNEIKASPTMITIE